MSSLPNKGQSLDALCLCVIHKVATYALPSPRRVLVFKNADLATLINVATCCVILWISSISVLFLFICGSLYRIPLAMFIKHGIHFCNLQ